MHENPLRSDETRIYFPALDNSKGFIFADNAGGSQCLQTVAESITNYLLGANVQLGASYETSLESSARVHSGAVAMAEFMGASSTPDGSTVIFGSSTTQILSNLSLALEGAKDIRGEELFVEGDQIVLNGEHEANVGPWVRMVDRLRTRGINVEIKFWLASGSIENQDVGLSFKTLESLLSIKTKLVAFSGCSNILGECIDIAKVVKLVKLISPQARTMVDCVALAPHRQLEVEVIGIDFLVWSLYKVYGAHCAVLYAAPKALASVKSLAHYFLKLNELDSYKLSPGGSPYELTASAPRVTEYILSLSDLSGTATRAKHYARAFERIAMHEEKLSKIVLEFLISQYAKGVRIVGPTTFSREKRVPTIAFVVKGKSSQSIVEAFDKTGKIGIRYGNFYAVRLLEAIGLDIDDGVVRISFVHYTTEEEARTVVQVLQQILE